MSARVVSREPQAAEIAAFLTSVVAAPCALVIEGEPGIGKTTLWLETIERAEADGFRVMAARPVDAESVLAYTSLADMLDGSIPRFSRSYLNRNVVRSTAFCCAATPRIPQPTSARLPRASCPSS
jgi:MoxR-like ATPase